MTIKTDVLKAADTPPELEAVITQRYREIFPNVGADGVDNTGIEWQDGDYRVLAWLNDEWGAIVEISPRSIQVGDSEVRVGGVGGVMSLPHLRGMGLAKAAMQRSVEFICAELNAQAGMLYCAPRNLVYYAKLGWHPIERYITYHQSTGAGVMDTTKEEYNAMIYPCGDFVFPDGDIDIKGKLW